MQSQTITNCMKNRQCLCAEELQKTAQKSGCVP